jgi:restriction endonuclease S subunit
MWTANVQFLDLLNDGRWKVEFFCDPSGETVESKYPMIPLRDLVMVRKESIEPKAEPDTLFNYIGLENVASHTGDLVDFKRKLGSDIRSRSKVFYEEDILYGRLRPYLNKVYLAEGTVSSGVCSGEFYVLQPDSSTLLPLFLRVVLTSNFVLKNVQRFQSGAALPRLAKKDLLSLNIPVPPLDHQQALSRHFKSCNDRRKELLTEANNLPRRMISDLMATLQTGKVQTGEPIPTKGY